MHFAKVMGRKQTDLLLDHFKVKPTITAREAEGAFKVRSLSRRINDLEAAGFMFSRTMEVDTSGQRYVRYHFLGSRKVKAALRGITGGKAAAPAMAVAA